MGLGIILALIIQGAHTFKEPLSGAMFWEETADAQRRPGVHPMVRFGCWDIIRYNRSTTYMFKTPDMVQQGQFGVDGNHYSFRAVMANELENADISKLTAEMDPESGRKLAESYARSMSNFEGTFEPSEQVLFVTYAVQGKLRTFELHRTDEGDDQLAAAVSDSAAALVGLWHSPEPFPDKLDARVRAKIGGIEGLQTFGKEAQASNGAKFGVLDLRVDGTFRNHDKIGRWSRNGAVVRLILGKDETDFGVSPDGTQLLAAGKPVFLRN